jgi:hypothetical protein
VLAILCVAAPAALAQDAARPMRSWPSDKPIMRDEKPQRPAPSVSAARKPGKPADMKSKIAEIPLPRPRPPEAGPGNAAVTPADVEQETVSTEPPPPSECFVALTTGFAIATPLPPIALANGCEAPDVVRLDAVLLTNKTQITLNPPATLRCSLATEIVKWVREDLLPATAQIGSLTAIEAGSFECRGRNRVVGAKISEHGKANALDIGALLFANKKRISLTDPIVSHDFREKIKANVCARFMTVLGPGSDGYHEEHIHLDLAERKNDYRICQWNVLDVPLPQPRPPEADMVQNQSGEQKDGDVKQDGGDKKL